MAVVKERKFEENRKFLIEPLNMLPLSTTDEVNRKKKVKVGVYVYVIDFEVKNGEHPEY